MDEYTQIALKHWGVYAMRRDETTIGFYMEKRIREERTTVDTQKKY